MNKLKEKWSYVMPFQFKLGRQKWIWTTRLSSVVESINDLCDFCSCETNTLQTHWWFILTGQQIHTTTQTNKYFRVLFTLKRASFFQCSTAFSAVMVGEVNKQILVLSFRLSNISILGHSQPCLLRIFSIWSGYFWQTTVEVPDEEKKVFVGGLPHDCKHEDVKVLS